MLEPVQIKMEPADIKQEQFPDSTTGNSPKKKAGRPKKMKQEKITDHMEVKKKRKVDRFKGMPEEEVITRLLPDHLAPNLDIVIVGINPGLYAAFVGHHYAGPGNHFWKCMYLSGLIPEPMNAMQDFKLLDYGIGFTNIVARTTRGSADLTRKEIKEGAQILTEKLIKYKPKIAVFNGKGIYEVFVGHKNFHFGRQPDLLPGTETAVYVMPSSSARCSQLPRAVDKVPFYEALRKFKDHLNGKLPDLDYSEITFQDVVLKTAVKKEVKEEEGEQYPGEFETLLPSTGDQQLGQFTHGSYQVIPHSVPGSSQVAHSSPFNIPNDENSLKNVGNIHSVQIKQEPVDPDSQDTLCMSVSHHQSVGKIKQEPDYDSQSESTSKSQTISLGQLEVYSQEASSSHNDSHLNNFLNSLQGLVSQVASNGQTTSKYGIVNQAGITVNGPVQFNDALRDIVRDNNAEDLESVSCIEVSDQPSSSQPSVSKPATKASKPRKRKSKSAEESPMSHSVSVSPPDQHYVPPYSLPGNQSQLLGNQPRSPSNQAPSPSNQQTSFHTMQPVPPFTSSMAPTGFPPEAYSNAFMPQVQYHPQMGYNYMQPHHSFTQMLGGGNNMMGYPGPENLSNFQAQMMGSGYPGHMSLRGGHNGFDPNMHIKQEKPDS